MAKDEVKIPTFIVSLALASLLGLNAWQLRALNELTGQVAVLKMQIELLNRKVNP